MGGRPRSCAGRRHPGQRPLWSSKTIDDAQAPAVAPRTYFVGIDLSARRGFDVAVLDPACSVVDLCRAATLADLCARLDDLATAMVVAIDAPQSPSTFPIREPAVRSLLIPPPPEGRYRRYRVCDYELARRGLPLYLLPEPGETPPDWMALGFATFARLRDRYSLRLPRSLDDTAATLIEVYPFAGFVTLLGGRPPRKTTIAGAAMRRQVLQQVGLRALPTARLNHDALDALCAAFIAWRWHHHGGSAVGLPTEGLIALPIPLGQVQDYYRSPVPPNRVIDKRY